MAFEQRTRAGAGDAVELLPGDDDAATGDHGLTVAAGEPLEMAKRFFKILFDIRKQLWYCLRDDEKNLSNPKQKGRASPIGKGNSPMATRANGRHDPRKGNR